MRLVNSAALYLRISREDGDRLISESIENQETLLRQYAVEHDIPITSVFIDDGVSGMTFDRPGFQQLLGAIEAKLVNIVLVKDLSRLGRDYIDSGHYLERYFPEKKIRFISVAEGIDTFKNEISGGLTLPLQTVFNDIYARDISRKVRSALSARRRNGQFIGSSPPFGYLKSELQKGALIIDPVAFKYVRQVFDTFLSGNSLQKTAQILTLNSIPTPSQYKHLARSSTFWNDSTVRRILSSPTYAGNLTQNRSRRISCKIPKKTNLPPSEWTISEGAVPAIVSKDEFDIAQKLLAVRAYSHSHSHAGNPETRLFSGLAFCECGAPMNCSGKYLVCSRWKRNPMLKLCNPHYISEERLKFYIMNLLNPHIQSFEGDLEGDNVHYVGDFQGNIDKIKEQLVENQQKLFSLLEQQISGDCFDQSFEKTQQQLMNRHHKLNHLVRTLKSLNSADLVSECGVSGVIGTVIDNSFMRLILEKIIVYSKNHASVFFRFKSFI